MSNSFKRFLSLALALMMVISMMPTTAFATDGEGTQPDAVVEDIIPEASSEPEEEPSETTEPEEEPSVDVCTHENQTTTTVDATCEADGSVTVTCECGEIISVTEIPALGHSYVEGICENCGETDPNAIAQINEDETSSKVDFIILDKDGKECPAIYDSSEVISIADRLNNLYMMSALLGAEGPFTYKVVLHQDVEDTEMIEIPADTNVVIDLNGYTLSQTKEQTAGYQMILNDGNLTINDSVGGGKISYTDSGNGGEYISDTIYNRGNLVINGGTIENLSSETVASYGYPHAVDTYSGIRDTSVTINDGVISCESYSAIRMFCVSASNEADLVINGGIVKGAIDMQNGTTAEALGSLTIYGGAFYKNASRANVRFANWNGGATEYGIDAAISGGYFDSGINTDYVPAAANWNGKIITGGTFGADVSTYVADGYEQGDDGAIGEAVVATAVAKIGDAEFATLAEALAAAQAGDEITLLGDVALESGVSIVKSITINGNGYTIAPADASATYNSAIMAGDSGWGDDHGETITLKNITFSGWKTNYGVVRAQGVTLVADNCDFIGSSVTNAAYAVLSLNYTDATVRGCEFKDNNDRAIDVNYNGDNSETVVTIDGCTFDGNTTTGAGIVMRSAGNIIVKNSVFTNNEVNTNGNGATLYVGFGAGNQVSGCTFKGNTVTTSHATTKRFASAIFCDGCVVNGNVFGEGNTAIRNGQNITTIVAVGAYYGAADISANYWGKAPVLGEDYTIEYTRQEVSLDSYYADAELTEKIEIKGDLSGSGTEADPYVIASLDDLYLFAEKVNGGETFDNQFVKLTADIDLAGAAWTPIGNTANKFLGTFDGGNHTISNLVVDVDTNNAGLFGFASVIKNVNINNAKVSGVVCVGALVGELESSVGTVDNCHVSGTIQITGENSVGGLAGKGYATIKNSSVDGNVDSFVLGVDGTTEEGDNIGGLMGHLGEGNTLGVSNVTVKNITVTGTRKVGGILGTTARGNDIIGCTVDNVVIESTATAEYADANASTTTIGGVIGNYFGSATSGGILKDCSVSNVTFVPGNAKSAGALVGGDRNNNGGAPVGVDTVSGNTVSNVTGATNKYLMPAVAQIGDETYATLQDAIDAAQAGETVTVIADIALTETVTVPAGKTITLDLNGCTVSAEIAENLTQSFSMITNKGNLTITDSGENGKLSLKYTGASFGYGIGLYTLCNAAGTVNIEGGIVENLTTVSGSMYDAIDNNSTNGTTTLNIEGGKVSCGYIAVRQFCNSTSGENIVNVTGGVVDGGNCSIWRQNPNSYANKGEINVEGGTFTGRILSDDSTGFEAAISGGQFTDTAMNGTSEELLADGYAFASEADANGLYTIVEQPTVAKIGDETYATLQDAIDAAQAGDEIVLLDNLTIESDLSNAAKGYFNIAEDDKIIIDLNGKKITATDKSSGNFILFYNYGELTIKNGTVELTATNDRAWNAQSTIILNRGGNLTIESGSYIHKGGTAMAYVVDNSGNSYGDATTTINGGILNSAYIGIRNRMDTYGANGNGNGIAKLVINGGEISGKYAVWGQVSSSGCKGEIVITGGKLSGAAGKAALLVDEDAAGEVKTVVSGGIFSSTVAEENCADGYAALPTLDGYFVVGEKPTATVKNLGEMTIAAGDYYVYNGSSLSTGDVDMPLNFVMQFVADQDAEDMEVSPFADWYADFVITFEGIEGGSFDPTGCYLAGYYGSTDSWDGMWVKIPVDGLLNSIDEGTRYPVMTGVGMPQTYDYICSGVQAFSCAMYIPEDIIAANPNLKVNLELNVVDSSDLDKALEALTSGENIYKASETSYEAEDFKAAVAKIGDVEYKSLQAAIDAAQARETVTVIADIALTETVTVPAGKTVTLDLNGYTISQTKECTASYEMISNKGNLTILDSSDEAGKISFTDTSAGDPSFGWGSYTIRNEGTLEVNDVTIEHLGEQNAPAGAVHMYCAIFQYSGSTTINGGKISTPTYRSVRLWKGDMTIKGGEFEGQVWVQAVDNTSKLTIKGGSFAPCGGDGSSVFITNATYDVALAVNGGTFNTKIGASAPAKLAGAITGGQFTEAAKNNTSTAMLADGYAFASEADANDLYSVVERAVSGEVAYRAYITDTDSREAIQIDLANVYAKESLVVELYDANGNKLTTTSLKAGAVDAAAYTCNIVLWGTASGSWDTEIFAELTAENIPEVIKVYADGTLVDEYTNAFGAGTNADKTAEYLALDILKPAVAKIGDVAYKSIQAAVDAADDGATVNVIADVSDEAVTTDKSITITGAVTLNNVSISGSTGSALTVSGLTFTGNSWINSNGAASMTVDGVTANVTPSNTAATNSRSAFISLGRSEQAQLKLTVTNSKIVSAGGSDPILGWAAITEATITGNTFGAENAHQNNSDSVKFMAIADGAVFTVTDNTVYSDYNGFVFGQNTTRGNAYTVILERNTFIGEADHVWLEVSGSKTCNATVLATSDNTVNGNAFTAADIKLHPNMTTFTGVLAVDAEKDAEGKLIGGTFTKEPIADMIAEGYEAKKDGNIWTIVESGLKGSGTEADPYQIGSLDDLILFRDSVNKGETKYNADGVYVVLTADIDMAGEDWSVNIGDDCSYTFDGIFDGNGKTISNLNATESAQKGDGYICTGLFGAIGGNAVVKNLTIENVNINTGDFVGNNAAAVVGFAYSCTGSVENVNVIGDIQINAKNVTGTGAIVGYDYYGKLTVKDCVVDGNDGSAITGAAYVGGIIGYASNNANLTENTVADVAITATSCAAGGIAGIMLVATATDNTIKNVTLAAGHENWQNSVASVVGTITSTVTVSGTTVDNVTTADGNAVPLVGAVHADKPTTPVAKVQAAIGNVYYTTFDKALAAAEEGAEITLLDNLTGTVELAKSIALDVNGNTVEQIVLTDAAVTLTTEADKLNVTTTVADHEVKYADGKYAVVEKAAALAGSIQLRSAALNLLDKVCIIYKASDGAIATNNEDVAERGVLIYDSYDKAAAMDPAQASETILLEWNESEKKYRGQSEGIDARDMGDSQFAVAYMKMTDGSYIFGTKSNGDQQIIEYSPLIYCKSKVNDATVGNLCRALMHYGAAAQVAQYGKTSGLMNEGFEAIAYDETVLGESVFSVDTSLTNGIKLASATLDLQGAISYIVKFTTDDSIEGKQLYAEYTHLGETGSVELVTGSDGKLRAVISGVPAKDLGATLKIRGYYLDENGEKVYGGELVYSGYEYVRRAVVNNNYLEADKDLSRALAMYIHYADVYGNG